MVCLHLHCLITAACVLKVVAKAGALTRLN
jgi:hypothetical protein